MLEKVGEGRGGESTGGPRPVMEQGREEIRIPPLAGLRLICPSGQDAVEDQGESSAKELN